MDFNFIRDERIKKIIIRDYAELQKLAENNISKSTIIISGGILESLLADALAFSKDIYFDKGYISNQQGQRLTLEKIIQLAKAKNIISKDNLLHTIRDFRNLVHIGKEIKEDNPIDLDEAKYSFHAINRVIKDLRKWYEKAIPLFSASVIEVEFLELFTIPEPNNIDYSTMRPWIKSEVFRAGKDLVLKNILISEELEDEFPKIKFQLTSGVSDFIDKITGKKVIRETIIIAFREVFANNASGSGATGSTN